MKHLLVLLSLFLFVGCVGHKHKQKVHVYTVPNEKGELTELIDDDFIYWYVINSDNGNSSYTYSSPTPVTNFSNAAWTSAASKPVPANAEEQPEQEISETELPAEVESDMEANSTENGNETADAEGGSESSEGSGDSGGDSGGGDGGGGDGGGGDGGGGGD